MKQPLVSVVIPFYTGITWLKDALNSVQNQTYDNMEVLLINDGSTEELSSIAELYNLNIRIINKENGGPASARNLGIEKSSGKYVAFLDSDDIWLPSKLLLQISQMEEKKSVWSQHSYEMFWEHNNKIKIINTKMYSGNVYKDCFISFKIQTSCVVVLRSVLIKNNIRFPVEKRYGQDGSFYRQIAQNYPLEFIEGVLSRFRIRGSNAGFRAKVQLNDRADTWEEIYKVKTLRNSLPGPIIYSYKICSLLSRFVNFLNKNIITNEAKIEVISKVVYIFPYIIFKLYRKK